MALEEGELNTGKGGGLALSGAVAWGGLWPRVIPSNISSWKVKQYVG